jgi:hypothetical protein
VPRGAVRLPSPVGDQSREHVVTILLRVMLVLTALGTLVGAVWAPEINGAFGLDETAMGVIFCVVIALLLVVNRLGYWQLATWGAMGCLVLGASGLVDLVSLDRVMIVTAVPTVLAAFLLRPRAAFELAALSAGVYTMEWLRHGPEPSYNFLSLMALVGIATIAYLAARRIQWLEEAEDISRCELDRLADERDILKGQVMVLADELERRDAAEAREKQERIVRGRGDASREVRS